MLFGIGLRLSELCFFQPSSLKHEEIHQLLQVGQKKNLHPASHYVPQLWRGLQLMFLMLFDMVRHA